jgi:hypothetical protein
MKRFQLLAALFFALTLSAWLGRAELHTDDTGILAGLIGLGSCLLAIVEPRRPWMWGVIVPAGVIGVEAWNHISKMGSLGDLLGIAVFTITIASIGAYIGSFIRRVASAAL